MKDTATTPAAEAPRRFLDAAARLFARDGFHAVSMRAIAREVGVTPGAVYAHYASKAAVLAAVYADGVERIAARVEAATAGADEPWERLERACRGHLEAILDRHAGYGQVVTRVLPDDVPELAGELTALRYGYERHFRALIEALPLGLGIDRTLFRMTLMGALNWSPVWYAGGRADPAAIAKAVVGMLRRGAASPPEGEER